MSIKYSEIFSADQILSAGPNDIIVIAVVDGASSTGYTTKAIKKSNLIADPLFTSLTTTGASGDAATLISGILNIPTPVIPAVPFTSLTTTGTSGLSTLISGVLNIPNYADTSLGVADQTLTGNRIVTMANLDMVFSSSGDSAMMYFAGASGSVGIGESPSLGKLHVDGTIASTDNLILRDSANGNSGILTREALVSSNQTWTLPDNTGTIALLSDIPVITGDGIYGGNGVIPAALVATLTDSIEFTSNFVGEAAFTISNTGVLGRSKIKIIGGTGGIQSMSLYTTAVQGHIIESDDPNGLHIVSTTANATISTLAGTIVDVTAIGDIQIVGTTDPRLLNTDFLNNRVRIGSTAAFPVKMIVQNTNPLDKVFVAVDSTGTYSMQFGENGVLSVNNIISVGNLSPSSASRIQTLGDIEITQTIAWYYLGDPTTDGSWRFGTNAGADFLHQKREVGIWVTKQTIVA